MSSPPEPRLHFSYSPVIDTDDLDEARGVLRRIYHDASADRFPGARSFRWRMNRVALGGIGFASGSFAEGCSVSTIHDGGRYILSFLQSGGGTSRYAGVERPLGAGAFAMMFSPGNAGRLVVNPGSLQLTFSIERATLEAHFRKLTGVEPRGRLFFHPTLAVGDGPGALLERVLGHVVHQLEYPTALAAAPLFARSLTETLLTAVLELAPHDHTPQIARPTSRLAPGYVRRAEEYMDAHATESIGLSDIAAAVGVSIRSLQAAFRNFRGRSPGDHLREHRLSLARAHLLADDPGTTVASVAAAAGYRQASHFGVEYKRRFGENPRATLLRRQGPPRPKGG